eukprot:CAMPEP_0167793426 /NCGR_PEP_ID=MMETSP0111_2-20121227/13174_1 /TAXON_ID=91324 /ORGANISM="Lotharella globosa, Strain CCCM811" /LENGTH=103 /DNA_ID=CAMNT_0007686583 /DNA_START=1103 /DNA_END=1412 /DNA_ORIENTATION=-
MPTQLSALADARVMNANKNEGHRHGVLLKGGLQTDFENQYAIGGVEDKIAELFGSFLNRLNPLLPDVKQFNACDQGRHGGILMAMTMNWARNACAESDVMVVW